MHTYVLYYVHSIMQWRLRVLGNKDLLHPYILADVMGMH